MAGEGNNPRDAFDDVSRDLLDNTSDAMEEVEEAEDSAGDDTSNDEISVEDEHDDGIASKISDETGEPTQDGNAKQKKKGKAGRAVKGFKKFVGSVFRPSASKLKWDVDASVSLRATYDSNATGEETEQEKPPLPEKPKSIVPTKKPSADVVPQTSRTVTPPPRKPPDITDTPDEPSDPYVRLQIMAAENEALRQRCRILLNTEEIGTRTREPICLCAFYSHLLSSLIHRLVD